MKMLGIAVLALLAVGVAAASASAIEWKAETYPVRVEAKQTETTKFTVGANAPVECSTTTYKSAEPEFLPAANISILFKPEYSGCKAFGFVAAEVTVLNGALFLLTWVGRTITTAIKQSKADTGAFGITIKIPAVGCEVTVAGPQEFTEGTTAENGKPGAGEIEATFDIKKIAYNSNQTGAGCPKNSEEATFTGKVAAKGFTEGGAADAIKFE